MEARKLVGDGNGETPTGYVRLSLLADELIVQGTERYETGSPTFPNTVEPLNFEVRSMTVLEVL